MAHTCRIAVGRFIRRKSVQQSVFILNVGHYIVQINYLGFNDQTVNKKCLQNELVYLFFCNFVAK